MVDVITFFLISDVANGFDGVAPYAMFQAGHFVLGLLASRCRPNIARALLVLWALKEVIFDNLVFGGSPLVAIDSVADLAFGRRGYAVALRITVPVYSVVRAQAALQPFPGPAGRCDSACPRLPQGHGAGLQGRTLASRTWRMFWHCSRCVATNWAFCVQSQRKTPDCFQTANNWKCAALR